MADSMHQQQLIPEQHRHQGNVAWGIKNRMIFVSHNITKKQDSNKPQMLVSLSHQAQL
jgi:hypothetical protein